MDTSTILVLNDSQYTVDLIKDLLIDAGYPSVLTHTGTGGFHKARDVHPDVILLDINPSYPGRGWQTLAALRLHSVTRHIPVLVCTTDTATVRDKADFLHSQGYDMLEKPFNIDDLVAKVRHLLSRPRSEERT